MKRLLIILFSIISISSTIGANNTVKNKSLSIAESYYNNAEYYKALKYYKKAIKQTKFHTEAYENMATSFLKTGDIKVTMPSTWTTEGSIFFRQDDPLPMTLLAVIPEVSVGG